MTSEPYSLENQCRWLKISHYQRLDEIARGVGKEGTEGYEQMGCYTCDGFDTKCEAYLPLRVVDKQLHLAFIERMPQGSESFTPHYAIKEEQSKNYKLWLELGGGSVE